MQVNELLDVVVETLEDKKGLNISVIDVQGKSSVTDYMIVATGTSDRHIKALADYVDIKVKEKGFRPLGIEGNDGSEWVLLDLGDIILHVMTAQMREFYQLEKLWQVEYTESVSEAM
jgi:ribosome-associated protein